MKPFEQLTVKIRVQLKEKKVHLLNDILVDRIAHIIFRFHVKRALLCAMFIGLIIFK